MKTAASYIKKKYDCYKGYSEQSIREVCHMWCEVIEEAQNDVKKEYEEKLRWIPVEEKLPEIDPDYQNFSVEVHVKNTEQSYVIAYYYFNEERWCFNNNSIDNVTHWRSFL